MEIYSDAERTQREALSKKALDTYTRCLNDHITRLDAIDNAFKSGELTEINWKIMNIQRDTLNLLTDMYGDEGRDQGNIDILKMTCVQGIEDRTDDYSDIVNQMSSRVYNMRLKGLDKVDFQTYTQLDDAAFVEQWPQIFENQLKLETALKVVGDLKKNPYINFPLIDSICRKAAVYSGLHDFYKGRIAAISNPKYADIDYLTLIELGEDEFNQSVDTLKSEDSETLEYINDIRSMRDALSNVSNNRLVHLSKKKVLGESISDPSVSFIECMTELGKKIAYNNLSKDDVLAEISDYIGGNAGLSKEEYLLLFKNKGYWTPDLTNDQIDDRRALSLKAASACIDYVGNISQSANAFDIDSLLDRQYSDEEYVESFAVLSDLLKANPAHPKALAFGLYNRERMNIIGSKYYQYACEDLAESQSAVNDVMRDIDDVEIKRLNTALCSHLSNKSEAIGYYIVNLCKYSDLGIIGIVGPDGEVVDIKSYAKIGEFAQSGKRIVLLDKEGKIHPLNTDGSKFPPLLTDAGALDSLETRIAVIGLNIHNVMASKYGKYEKQLRVETFKAQKELMLLLRDIKSPHFEERFKECIGNLCTYLAIQNAAQTKGMQDEEMSKLLLKETQIGFKEAANSSGLIDTLAAYCRSDINHLPKLEIDDINKLIVKCNTELSKRDKKAIDIYTQEKYVQFRDKSIRDARRIKSAFTYVSESLDRDKFFNYAFTPNEFEDLMEETTLKSMRILEASVNTLTLAKMLNLGYSPDETMSNDASTDRAMIGREAMELIRSNDPYNIRGDLAFGLSKLNDYVNDELSRMDDYGLSEMARPEHRTLLRIAPYLRYMAQEFDNCQMVLEDFDKAQIPLTDEMMCKSNLFGNLITGMTRIYEPKKLSVSEILPELKSYIKIQMCNKYLQRLKELPENAGQSFDRILTVSRGRAFEEAFALMESQINIRPEFQSADILQKIHESILDDSLKDNLNISFKLPDKNNKQLGIQYTLEAALKAASRREALDNKLDISLVDPTISEEFAF